MLATYGCAHETFLIHVIYYADSLISRKATAWDPVYRKRSRPHLGDIIPIAAKICSILRILHRLSATCGWDFKNLIHMYYTDFWCANCTKNLGQFCYIWTEPEESWRIVVEYLLHILHIMLTHRKAKFFCNLYILFYILPCVHRK